MTLDLEAPDFRNATQIAFSTGPKVEPGLHTIRIERIELTGKLIPPSTFRLGIIAVWMLSVFGYLVIDSLLKRNQLRLSAASQNSLQRLNESLRLETRSLAEIARTDPLTGALNRKGLADELMRIVRLGEGQTFPMTLVFIDIDHFKRINDTHGPRHRRPGDPRPGAARALGRPARRPVRALGRRGIPARVPRHPGPRRAATSPNACASASRARHGPTACA